jgi:phage gp46-like protein
MFDFKLSPITNDIIINNDIEITNELYTHILVSFFTNKDKDIILDKDVGSDLYKFYQSKITTNTLTNIKNSIKNALNQLDLDYNLDILIIKNNIQINVYLLNVSNNNITKYTFTI